MHSTYSFQLISTFLILHLGLVETNYGDTPYTPGGDSCDYGDIPYTPSASRFAFCDCFCARLLRLLLRSPFAIAFCARIPRAHLGSHFAIAFCARIPRAHLGSHFAIAFAIAFPVRISGAFGRTFIKGYIIIFVRFILLKENNLTNINTGSEMRSGIRNE